jgi:hypothetical protein
MGVVVLKGCYEKLSNDGLNAIRLWMRGARPSLIGASFIQGAGTYAQQGRSR